MPDDRSAGPDTSGGGGRVPHTVRETPQPDWRAAEDEIMRHYQAVLRLDTTNPPGNEHLAVEYLKKVFDAENIPSQVYALDPNRSNIVARLKGNGKKRPLLIMGHTEDVTVDASKWKSAVQRDARRRLRVCPRHD